VRRTGSLAALLLLSCAHEGSPPAPVAPSPPARDYSNERGAFFGDSRCAGSKLLLCEDFESGALDPATWKTLGDAPVVEEVRAARGKRALHVVKNGNGRSAIRVTRTFPVPNNTYYARMFVYFDSLPTEPMSYAHWTFAAATGTGVAGEIRLSGQLQRKANRFGVGTDNRKEDGTGDWTSSDRDPDPASNAVPEKQWLCIEWMHDGGSNQTRFWWDGVEHPSLATTPTRHGGKKNVPFLLPRFDALWFGWQEYQPSTQRFELWIDEVAIDTQRIGCVL
jgi:hypothetical protein